MFLNYLLEKRSTNNVSEVTIQLLKKLRIPVTNTTAIDQVERHPDFPSLLSISDSLAQWKVENMALEVEPERLEELPTPFIAYTKEDGGNFVLVEQVNGHVDYINKNGRKVKNTREAFLKGWNGVVLLAENGEGSGEPNYTFSRRKELFQSIRMPAIMASCLVLVLLFLVLQPSIAVFPVVLLLIKLAGCGVAGLLLWFEVDKSNPVLKQICSGGKQTNCNAVLGSKQSKLFGILSWSEIGFYYFAGGFLMLLTSVTPLSAFSLLAWMNLLALPYPVFSVYYQWKVARQWCPLCLTVQGLLLLEAAICFWGYWIDYPGLHLTTSAVMPTMVALVLPVFFWMATKQVYVAARDAQRNQKELSKLKYNKDIFDTLLKKQKQIEVSTEGLGIVLGDPAAEHTIIKVCNPYCGPCAKAHPVIDELLEEHNIKVQIIFTLLAQEERAQIVKHFMALYEKGDQQLIQSALNEWYNSDEKDYEAFSKKYLLHDNEITKQTGKLEAMNQWCTEVNISFTPTIFIDGYQMPTGYKTDDLKHLL